MDSPSPSTIRKKQVGVVHTPSPQVKKSRKSMDITPPSSSSKREDMLSEILDLEKNYIRDLTVLIKVFRDPLMKSGLLKTKDVRKIFRDPENIREMNRSFLAELTSEVEKCDRPRDAMVGPIFEKYSKIFRMYYDFIRDHEASEKLLDDKIAKDADLRQALKTASRTRPEARNMPVRLRERKKNRLLYHNSIINNNNNNTGSKLPDHARSADSEICDSFATTLGVHTEITSRS